LQTARLQDRLGVAGRACTESQKSRASTGVGVKLVGCRARRHRAFTGRSLAAWRDWAARHGGADRDLDQFPNVVLAVISSVDLALFLFFLLNVLRRMMHDARWPRRGAEVLLVVRLVCTFNGIYLEKFLFALLLVVERKVTKQGIKQNLDHPSDLLDRKKNIRYIGDLL
jgi:hypothetical protein